MKGILIDVVNEVIEKRMGIPVAHKGYPWRRAQELVKNGAADAYITVPTAERKTYTEVSSEYVVVATYKLFVNSKTPRLQELKAVKAIAELNVFRVGHFMGSGWAKKTLLMPA